MKNVSQSLSDLLRKLQIQGLRIGLLEMNPQRVKFELYLESNLSYFAGHFPEKPVLPGIVQVHWAGLLSEATFGLSQFSDMQKIKFIDMALPQSKLVLTLDYLVEKSQVTFLYQANEGESAVLSSGVLKFSSEQMLGSN